MVGKLPTNPIPFLVADRKKSLELLRYSGVHKQSFPMGIMGNANSSPNFRKEFKKFTGKNIVKITDSGVFTKDGGLSSNYSELFTKYEEMGTDYGIILDVLKNKNKTIKSAKNALKEYKKKKRSFRLIGVAQGKTVKEYLECYKTLKKIGYKYIAIGGLLAKKENTARYVTVRNESFLEKVVKEIRSKYPKDWLFLLGCFHPKRFQLLKKYKIFGADFKGWIFNYKNPVQIRTKIFRHLKRIEDSCGVKDRALSQLLRGNSTFVNLDTSADQERFYKILKIRKKLSKKIKIDEYDEKLKILDNLETLSDDQLRENRFEEVNQFLNKKVYSLMKPKKLLVVSCSERKKNDLNLMPAIERYDGPTFRMLRKQKSIFYNGIDVLIVSAKYGLMPYTHNISDYDQRLSKTQIPTLKKQTTEKLSKHLKSSRYNEIMFSMGKDYLALFDDRVISDSGLKVKIAQGKIGEKLHQTKKWLSQN